MSFKEFQAEVKNNRPRLALFYLEPVVQELLDRIEQLEAHCCKCDVVEDEQPKVSTAAKKAPAKKKAAAPKVEAKDKSVDDIES